MGFDRLPNSAVIGQYYDQIYAKIETSSGNARFGIYDNTSSSPNNLLQETGQISCPGSSTYNANSLTEFAVTTTQLWTAVTFSNNTATIRYGIGANAGGYKSRAFQALPNPAPSFDNTYTYNNRLKIGHS